MDRKIAPTVILVQAGSLIFVFSREGLGIFWNLFLILIPLGIVVALIAVYIERMKEIDEEEKDDLSKY